MRLQRHWPAPAVAILAALAGLAPACGIPLDQQARDIDHEGREDILVGASTTTATTAPQDDVFVATLYFVGPDDKLERTERPYAETPTINDILRDLEEGPTPEELDQFQETVGNLKTSIPAGLSAQLLRRDEERGVQLILVDPEAQLRQLLIDQPATTRPAVKQIVCTVLHLPTLVDKDISGVEIYDVEEEPIQLTDDAAQPLAGPATVEDFGNCTTGTDEREAALLEAEAEGEESTTTTS